MCSYNVSPGANKILQDSLLACLGLGVDCCPCKDVDKPTKWGRRKPPPIRKSLTVFFFPFFQYLAPQDTKRYKVLSRRQSDTDAKATKVGFRPESSPCVIRRTFLLASRGGTVVNSRQCTCAGRCAGTVWHLSGPSSGVG